MSFRHETERLVLRSWRDGDAGLFHEHLNTPAVTRYLGGVFDFEQIADLVERLQASERERGYTCWAVERREDGAFLGFCGIKLFNPAFVPDMLKGRVEVGWRLREDAWGKGYAKEGAAASLDLAFNRFALSEIDAMTMAANMPSWGLMRRLGMTARPDLDFEMPGYGPHVVYRLRRDEWTA